jgi:hypothetical protein
MRITLQVHGGLMAGIRRKPISLDTAALSEQEAADLSRLVQEAQGALENVPASQAVPDAMTYVLEVQDGAETRVLKQSDASLTPEFDRLLARVEQHMRGPDSSA